MADTLPETIEILERLHRRVTKLNALLWRGDSILCDDVGEPDYQAYILVAAHDPALFHVVHLVGYHGGSEIARIAGTAASSKARAVRLSWLKENWSSVMPVGTFENARFFALATDT